MNECLLSYYDPVTSLGRDYPPGEAGDRALVALLGLPCPEAKQAQTWSSDFATEWQSPISTAACFPG